jgi:hypothetical protein
MGCRLRAAALPTGGKERQNLCLPFGCAMCRETITYFILNNFGVILQENVKR